jgi:hypothetical protein
MACHCGRGRREEKEEEEEEEEKFYWPSLLHEKDDLSNKDFQALL